MKTIGLLVCVLALTGCTTTPMPHAQPMAPTVKRETTFPQPTESQSNQLLRLDALLRGSIAKLDLSWVVDMGAAAIPTCVREVGDKTLPAGARDLILIVLGNALQQAEFNENPDAKNDLVVTVLLEALNDEEPRVRRSAGYAARFVDDSRLVPALEARLSDSAPVQEQAVLALGTSGREPEIVPIVKLFLGTDSGTFRYSCLYSLAMMCLLHDVDVASVLRQNTPAISEKDQSNLDSVAGRFVDFKAVTVLVRRLSSSDLSERRDADKNLRKLTGKTIAFDPDGDTGTRQRGIERWRKYFLKDYWLVPPPSKS
jgi:hypothetical protein